MMRRLAVIWVLVAALAPRAGIASTRVVDGFTFVEHAGELSEILHSLGSASAINIVIMGDGFTLGEQGEFDADADDFIDEFFQFPPYSGRSCAFTIWKINLVSTDSGIDYYHNGTVFVGRDTPLDCSFGTSSQPAATITGDFALCRQAAAAADLPSDCFICVIVNDDISHDGAMSYQTEMVTFMSSLYPWGVVMAHELGHLLVGLGDEYPCKICNPTVLLSDPSNPDLNRTYPGSPPIVAPNLSTTYARTSIPWSAEIAAGTALPTVPLTPNNDDEVGAWEGGGTYAFGVYRPQRYCVMDVVMYQDENLDKFCEICNQTLTDELQFRCILHLSPLDLGVLLVSEPIRIPIPPCKFCPDSLQDYIRITMFAERYLPSLPPLPRIEVYDDWGKTVATSPDWHDGRVEVLFQANRVRSYRAALNFNAPESGDLVLRSEIYVNGVRVNPDGR